VPVFKCCVLMEVPNNDDDCIELLDKLRCAVSRKKLKAQGLIRYLGKRVKSQSRLQVQPIAVCIIIIVFGYNFEAVYSSISSYFYN